MRTRALWLFVSLGLWSSPVAADPPDAVRAMDGRAAQAVEHGRASSASFRALLAGLDPGRIVVHVVSGDTVVFGTAGATRLAGKVGAWRYLRITLDADLPLDERTAVLAHELQHVHEIVGGGAGTQRDVELLYERIGRKVATAHNAFETPEAIAAGARVWRELRRPSGRHAGATRTSVEH